MASINDTPSANRIHIAFFGLRNAGKSTLVNEFTGQELSIVSVTPGTTTDPVSKSMEILPLGPCLITDTAGLDDVGELGEMRVKKTLAVLATTDIAVWVASADSASEIAAFEMFNRECQKHATMVITFHRSDSIVDLKHKIATAKLNEAMPGLLDGLVKANDRVICVCPIDESAPKGRLILPQVQVIRDCLDCGALAMVCQTAQLSAALKMVDHALVITDSQAFGEVKNIVSANKADIRLTSFSVLFARQKGDLTEYAKGMAAIRNLKDGDCVLIAEGCTHHRQCNDIGSVKIPKALKKLSGKNLNFEFVCGNGFWNAKEDYEENAPKLIVHCGGCMLTRREMFRRIHLAIEMQVPIVNYGLVLAAVNGIDIQDVMV